VLDVGCGTGRLLGAIAAKQARARLAGVDPAPGMAVAARCCLPQPDVRFLPADVGGGGLPGRTREPWRRFNAHHGEPLPPATRLIAAMR
jgi:SAM-dependent methyltransferase